MPSIVNSLSLPAAVAILFSVAEAKQPGQLGHALQQRLDEADEYGKVIPTETEPKVKLTGYVYEIGYSKDFLTLSNSDQQFGVDLDAVADAFLSYEAPTYWMNRNS